MKAQIKAIIASAVVVVLCLSAIGGVTYSWFSDTESSNININTAHINIGITSIEKGTVTGYGDAEINQTTRSITINNLAANCTIPLTFTLSNDSSIDIVYVLKTTINDHSALDDDTKQHVKINGNTLSNQEITEVGSIIDDETTEFVIPVTISSDSSYGNGTDVQSPRTIQMTFDVIAYQADYPTNTLVSGEAKISSNKIVQGDAYKDSSDAKEIKTIVDLSSVSNVTGTIGGASTNVDVSNLSIKVESKSDNNGFDTGVGTIGLTLFNGSDSVNNAKFGSETVTVTATIKDVMTNPGIVQVLYKAENGTIEHIETTSYVYDSTNKTLTVTFKTTHFSNFTVISAVAEVEGKYYASLKDAIDSIPVPTEGELLPEQTITILSDIDNAYGISVKSGKYFTIDFNGHVYTVTKPGAGSKNTETNAFQLLKNSKITMINGTICIGEDNLTGTLESGQKRIMRIIQNYSDLTLDNMIINAENQYGGTELVMSFNEGNSIINNCKVINVGSNTVAFDNYAYVSGGYSDNHTLTITNSNIDGIIELGGPFAAIPAIVINNSSYSGLHFGSDYKNAWFVVDNVMVTEDSILIYTADELKNKLTLAGYGYSGSTTVDIMKDIIIPEDFTWIPINVDGYHGAGIVTVNGNNHTITGLKDAFFAGGFAGTSGIVINDLTLDKVEINDTTESQGLGAFIKCIDSMPKIELNNCHLTNSTINSTGGARVGGLIGWNSGYSNPTDGPVKTYVDITSCSVENCTISAKGSVGGIVGHAGASDWTWNTITDCKVINCNLTSYDDSWRVGVAVGTANAGHVTISNVTSENNTLKQIDQEQELPSTSSNELYGRTSFAGTGSLTIDGTPITE